MWEVGERKGKGKGGARREESGGREGMERE